jgi:hypothetical protein
MLAIFLAILCAASQATGSVSDISHALSSAEVEQVRGSADFILSCQCPNGMIAQRPERKVRVVPYFANLACIGLLRAYQVTGDRRYLESVLQYTNWYATHMNSDGTIYDWVGTRTEPVSESRYDSSDAYPALFIALCFETYRITHDRGWLQAKYPCIVRSVDGILLTWQQDGLTFARPVYKVKYLMDNLEVRIGLRAAVKIAEALEVPDKINQWNALVDKNRHGLNGLWLPQEGRFAEAMFQSGKLDKGFSKWYPDGMANAMSLACILDEHDPKAQQLSRQVKDRFPGVSNYWWFISMYKFGYRDEAVAIREKMGSAATSSVDKGAYIRAFVPEQDDFWFGSDRMLLGG